MNSSKNCFARRTFLFLGMKAAAVAALAISVPARVWARFIEQFPVRTVEEKTFSFDPQNGNVIWSGSRKEPFRLTVDGLVEQKAVFDYADLRSWDRTEQVSDFHCVEGWSVADLTWGRLPVLRSLEAGQAQTRSALRGLSFPGNDPLPALRAKPLSGIVSAGGTARPGKAVPAGDGSERGAAAGRAWRAAPGYRAL